LTTGAPLQSLLSEKRFDLVESAFEEALESAVPNAETLLAALRGLARAGQKARVQALAGLAESELKRKAGDLEAARLRWTIVKESVRAGATPSAPDGFHRLFEDALSGAWPGNTLLATLLGKFKFREAKEPGEGLARAEKAEAWLPFEVGKVFSMTGRGAGRVVETNYALNVVRLDFESAKGIAVPIGIAGKQLVALPPGHFLAEKLSAPDALRERVVADPGAALKHLVESVGRPLTMTEVKDAVKGLVSEDLWTSWWTSAKKNPQVLVHGSGKNATVEWSHSADAAGATLLARFAKADLKDKLDLFRKNQKRSPELAASMAKALAAEAERMEDADPAAAFEIAVLVEKAPGVSLALDVERHVLARPLELLPRLSDRIIRERALELIAREKPSEAAAVLSEWMFKEEDGRTIEAIDRRLAEIDPAAREKTLEKVLKNPRSGPRAFVWFAQRAATDETLRAKLTPAILGRLLDAITWEELGGLRTKVREMFDRTGIAAGWLVKQATLSEARTFLDALSRHHELEPLRRDGLVAAAEMRFLDLRKAEDDTFFVTAGAIDAKRAELEHLLKVEIPENTKGIALAAAEGDLSENFEYKARRDKQQLLSARAGKLQEELGKARALDPAAIDTTEVRPGTRVTLREAAGGTERSVTLLGPWDSKPEEGVYSYLSDLGKALLGKTVGEKASVLGEDMQIQRIDAFA
jgi:transcription elongation GreA/GreB family factor